MRHLLAAAALVAAAFAPARLGAQQGWTIDLSAGRAIYDPVAASIGTDNVMLGVQYVGVRPVWFYLSGGTPISSEGTPWGAAGLGGRISSDRIPLPIPIALDLGAHLFGYSYSTTDTLADAVTADSLAGGATLEILPGLFFRWRSVDVELQSGLVQYTLALPDSTDTRRVHHSAMRAMFSPVPPLGIVAESRYLRTPEGDYPYVGARTRLAWEPGYIWAGAGRWLSDEIPTPLYDVGVGVRLGARLEVQAGWQQESRDPLYWNAPRTSWMVRISHSLGRRPQMPAPAPVPVRTSDGRIIIRIAVESSATTPYILGDFTNWQPVPMVRSGNFWEAALAIAPGVYHYGFRTEEGQWFIPSSIPAQVNDGMGGTSAVLIVP